MLSFRSLLTAAASFLVGACAVPLGHKPYLTNSAFSRAAATCHVISEGVHHAIGSKVPYANYRLAVGGADMVHDDQTHDCLANALTKYRYDYFGEAFAPADH